MTQSIIAYLVSDYSDADIVELELVVRSLASHIDWTIAQPEFIDSVDSSACTRPEDEPIRTVGAVLPVSAPGDEPSTRVEEVERLLEELRKLSGQRSLEFEVQLGDTYVGTIFRGELDTAIQNGLLATW